MVHGYYKRTMAKDCTIHSEAESSTWQIGQAAAEGMRIVRLCQMSGMSRQNYYKGRHIRQRRHIDETVVLSLVRRERRLQSKIGTRKLHHMLREELIRSGVSIGRDGLFGVLRRNKMLIARRRRYCRTTDSRHNLKTYSNLLKDTVLMYPGAAMVSDITYISTGEGFCICHW